MCFVHGPMIVPFIPGIAAPSDPNWGNRRVAGGRTAISLETNCRRERSRRHRDQRSIGGFTNPHRFSAVGLPMRGLVDMLHS
jgi:hypothetical protein